MHLKYLLTTATVVSLPAVSALYDPDNANDAASRDDGPSLMMIKDVEDAGKPPDGDVSITNLIAPTNGNGPPAQDEVSITTTTEEDEGPKPELYEHSLLIGPTWTASKYRDASKDILVDVVEGSTITLEFEEDGRFDGNAGCNNYFGSFGPATTTRSAASPESFTITGPIGSTMMFCEDFMDQEAAYLANLQGTIKFHMSEDSSMLELKDAETDKVVAEYTHFTPLLLDQIWTATEFYSSEEEGLVDVAPGIIITLTMEVNEQLGGMSGCNAYFGSYDDLTSTSFSISGPLGGTTMECQVVDNVMEQERLYLENFDDGSKMKWAILADGSLELRDSDSNAVIAKYTAGFEAVNDPLSTQDSTSGGMSISSAVSVFAIVAVMIFV